jgi:eukaryotic-like serine/threonine-protein kinase
MVDAAGSIPRKIGRYEVVREVGRGTMGVVYEARDPTRARAVALKAIDAEVASASGAVEDFEQRFFEEARVAARLSHPNIVVCHDVGKDESTGTLFIVLEYLRGLTLAERLKAGALRWPDAVEIVAKVSRAIDHAHQAHVVHRHLKPSNIMLLESGEPKVLDFGIARVETVWLKLTAAGSSLDSPLYMSPEQTLGPEADAHTNIFSLGSILCTLLLGRPIFAASSTPEILGRITRDAPPPLSRLVHGVPPAVDDVVARAMAKAPADRYENARLLAEDLEDILASHPLRHAGTHDDLLAHIGAHHELPAEIPRANDALDELHSLVGSPGPTEASTLRSVAGATASRQPRALPLLMFLTVLVVLMTVAALLGAFLRHRQQPAPPLPAIVAAEVSVARASARPSSAQTSRATVASTRLVPVVVERKKAARTAAPTRTTGGKSTLHVTIKHPLKSGRLRLFIDGRLAFETPLSAKVKKKMIAFRSYGEEIEKTLEVAPGPHDVRVVAIWDHNEKTESLSARFEPNATRELAVEIGGLRKHLSLEWRTH